MSGQSLLSTVAILLAGGVLSVPVAKRLGLGSVLGYLAAGALIGPFCLKLLANSEGVMHVAEFGVVLLLFLIGLELNPRRLWELRSKIFGLGFAQVALTVLIVAICLLPLGWTPASATVAGLGFAMSSTAIVLQILAERGLSNSPVGKDSFSVLLFQDLAVIPILALLPLLGSQTTQVTGAGQHDQPAWLRVVIALGVIGLVIWGSKKIICPALHWIAKTRQKEIITAASLLIVVGIAMLMDSIGLSMALGTFLAGVVLAESEYRHELESNIEPFKGLLLGIFFTAVGSSMQFPLLVSHTWSVLSIVAVLLVGKIFVLKLSGRLFKQDPRDGWMFAVLLSQGGEFAFVLFSTARGLGALSELEAAQLTLAVALSMFTTPFLLKIAEKFLFSQKTTRVVDEEKANPPEHGEVMIAGMGRFGQIVARMLHVQKIRPTVIDYSPELLDLVRPFGYSVYYGDATQISLLESAGLAQAKVLVLAIDDRESCVRIAEQVRKDFPHVKVVARAYDLVHAHDLMAVGVSIIERETFNAAVAVGEKVMVELGIHPFEAKNTGKIFHHYDNNVLKKLYDFRSQRGEFVSTARAAREDLVKLFEADDESSRHALADAAWTGK
ncbi:MAG: hypothetical protein RLZZ488_449 [Pseudomonadota bacterium]|jgi:glutathione-regulated potassium-efflux system ancillary protein KefC